MVYYDYRGRTWRKRKQDAKNALHYRRHIKVSNIKKVKFNKNKDSKGFWVYHALVKSKK
jgi:hypothetical protein